MVSRFEHLRTSEELEGEELSEPKKHEFIEVQRRRIQGRSVMKDEQLRSLDTADEGIVLSAGKTPIR